MPKLATMMIAALVALMTPAHAQDYPTKPIRVLVPFAPGGVVDTSTRILTNKLTERLGWTFVIDADGTVARVMRRVKPDTHAADVLAALPAT